MTECLDYVYGTVNLYPFMRTITTKLTDTKSTDTFKLITIAVLSHNFLNCLTSFWSDKLTRTTISSIPENLCLLSHKEELAIVLYITQKNVPESKEPSLEERGRMLSKEDELFCSFPQIS